MVKTIFLNYIAIHVIFAILQIIRKNLKVSHLTLINVCSYLIKRKEPKRYFGGLDNLEAKPNIFRCALRKPKSFIFGNTSQHAVSYHLQDAITVNSK